MLLKMDSVLFKSETIFKKFLGTSLHIMHCLTSWDDSGLVLLVKMELCGLWLRILGFSPKVCHNVEILGIFYLKF